MASLPEPLIRPAQEADYASVATALRDWWTMPGFQSEVGARERAALVPRLWLQHFAHTSLVAEAGHRFAGFLVGFLSADKAFHRAMGFEVEPGTRQSTTPGVLAKADYDGPGVDRIAFVRR